MIDKQFTEISLLEYSHFWYKARREIIKSVLSHFKLLNKTFAVLDIGAANGTNIEYFKSDYPHIKGMEINDNALEISKLKLPTIEIQKGCLPYNIPFENERFDLIFLFDVLEHIEDDVAALNEIYKRLNPGGTLIMTVPAYQFLFGGFDVYSHHFRRYSARTLNAVIKQTEFTEFFNSYFNFFLFPIILISRMLENIFKKSSYSIKMPGCLTNWLFYGIMSSEKKRLSIGKRYPLGSSLLVLLRKN